MLINEKLKAVFLHCPKCAGNTVRKWLEDSYGFHLRRPFDEYDKEHNVYESHRYVVPEEYRDWYCFTMCREPFSRWVSFWRYCRKAKNNIYEPDTTLDFEDFTKQCIKNLPLQIWYMKYAIPFPVEYMEVALKQIPFVKDIILPQSLNVSEKLPFQWTNTTIQLVSQRFAEDIIAYRDVARQFQ